MRAERGECFGPIVMRDGAAVMKRVLEDGIIVSRELAAVLGCPSETVCG